MRSLFTKRDVASESRDQYGRWTNMDAAHAYAHWKVKERGTAKQLAQDAYRAAGRRGELLRRKVFASNDREFRAQGGDKVRSQDKRLDTLLRIHAQHMGLVAPEEQVGARAAIFAHAVQFNQGPLGRLTPSYRDMIRRKVKDALGAEDEKMKAAMTARKPRASKTAVAASKTTPAAAVRSKKAVVAKFNQEHDPHGMFTGPGGSHDPTGNPRGRPPGGGKPSLGQQAGQAALDIGGSAIGGYAGSALFGAAGAAIGGPPGAVIGGTAGKWAGSVLGSLAGDYVAAKIGQSLLGIKEQADGHAIGSGEIIGGIAGSVAPVAASALIPGGGAVSRLFSPTNFSLASHVAEEATGGIGAVAGHVADQRASERASTGGHMRKSIFDAPPKSYNGSFGSMSSAAMPHIFGPRAWKKIADTPFGAYVRQKVKDAADKMDDAAEAQGMNLKPAKPAQVSTAHTVMQQAEVERQQQEQALMAQQAQQPQKPGVQKSLFRKAFTMPMRSPNDAVARDARQTGGAANVNFLPRMQESDRKNREAQFTRMSMQPRMENLARKPSEDEQAYRRRVQQLMAQSVKANDLARASLFTGGEAGQRRIYRVSKKRSSATTATTRSNEDPAFTIEAEFAKDWNSQDKLDQGLVYGWASIIEKNGQIVTDHQGDRITSDELVKAAHDYVNNSRQGGVLHDEYGHQIGHIVESIVFTKELQGRLGIDLGKVGWLIGYQIVDPKVKMLAKAGLLKSFSIGGRGKREPVTDAHAA